MAETMLLYSDEHGLPHYAGVGKIMRGWSLSMQGRAKGGIAQMRRGLTELRAAETEQQRANYLGLLAEALCKAGQTEEGIAAVNEALQAVADTGERFSEAELYRIKGNLLIRSMESEDGRESSDDNETRFSPQSSDFYASTKELRSLPTEELRIPESELMKPLSEIGKSKAEACFQKAIGIACSQNARLFELRAVMSLARLWHREGKRAEAREMLSQIYSWFTEGFDTSDLKEARALLEELS